MNMKKLLLKLFSAVICLVMICGACSRVCTCGDYVGIFRIGDEYEQSIPIGDKCSSLNTWNDELKMGTKCR